MTNVRLNRNPNLPPDLSDRVIVLDTEGRGFHDSDRCSLVEIAAVEIAGGRMTGRRFHSRINPQAPINRHAAVLHGLSSTILSTEPTFDLVVPDLMEFLGDADLVAHGAGSDRALLNHDLAMVGQPVIPSNHFVCTERIAKRLLGINLNLDTLCDRFAIDRSNRAAGHGALIDAELTAKCLLALARLPGYSGITGVRPIPRTTKPGRERVTCRIVDDMVQFMVLDSRGEVVQTMMTQVPLFPDTHEARAGQDGCLRITHKNSRAPQNPTGPALLSVINGEIAAFNFINGKKIRSQQ